MENELQRLSSFNSASWPQLGASVTPERLAAAGFYSLPTTESPDRVVCFSCENALMNWGPTDDPWIEHKTWYPTCEFVQGKQTSNVPIQRDAAVSLQQFPSVKIQTASSCDSFYVLGLLDQLQNQGASLWSPMENCCLQL